jgi:beta-mannanase
MISVEPWGVGDRNSDEALKDIVAGDYDPVILEMARTIDELEQPVLVRFAHEMDLEGIYPWSRQQPSDYIAAYRHVVDLFRANEVANVLWIWSPAGTLDALDYYPGDEYVDYAGLTILQFTPWEIDAGYDEPRPIEMLIAEKYDLLKPLDKPIILAEFGVAFDPELKDIRIAEMIDVLSRYPLIRGLVYFNQQNPEVSVTPYRPHWELLPEQTEILRATLGRYDWVEQQPRAAAFEPHFLPQAW